MKPLTDSGSLTQAIQRVKHGARRFTTNWFVTPAQVSSWIGRNALYYAEATGSLLLFRRDQGLYHLHHVVADLEGLSAALSGICPSGVVLTADLVGRPHEVSPVAEVYGAHGFAEHTSLIRMVRLAVGPESDGSLDAEVNLAETDDIPDVRAFLGFHLDRLRDQIPQAGEIEAAVARHNILIVRRGGDLKGLLFFDSVGVTSVLRYWYVDHDFRDQGVGARLIRAFFRFCAASTRLVLWVVADNATTIAKYEHYGFRRENLVDSIMIRGLELK